MQHLAGFYESAALTFVFYKLTHCHINVQLFISSLYDLCKDKVLVYARFHLEQVRLA